MKAGRVGPTAAIGSITKHLAPAAPRNSQLASKLFRANSQLREILLNSTLKDMPKNKAMRDKTKPKTQG